jgi:hypothetical protein
MNDAVDGKLVEPDARQLALDRRDQALALFLRQFEKGIGWHLLLRFVRGIRSGGAAVVFSAKN